ncbi:MAG: class IV adenylate cyclase [Terriglobales bacterium]
MPAAILTLMSSPLEVEIKFRIANIEGLVARLSQLGFQQVTLRTHEMNTLFDLPGHPLRDRGDVLRLRKYGQIWVLTHKTKSKKQDGPHKTRIETETRVDNGEKMEAILRALQFEPSFRYEKFRAEWKDGNGHVVIDETPIGNFGEIEGPPEWIDSVARDLGIDRKDYITETYAGLFNSWKRQTKSVAEEMTFEAIGCSRKC